MIKKLICLVWGCKRTQQVFTGEYGSVFSKILNSYIQVPVMRIELAEVCPRCGTHLRVNGG